MKHHTYKIDGLVGSASGTQYVYDAEQQRVQAGTNEFIYFQGRPVALYNTSTGGWTDLIWAGNNLLAEVAGNQTATPVYRLLDHEGTLAMTTDGSGNVLGSNNYAPYGQMLTSTTNDPYVFTGLYADTEYSGDGALYRNYSATQSRWLRPDPYNGSYDLMNPQSFNRYMYVNGNPLGYTDPSGLAGAGVLTGVGGSACKVFQGFKGIPIGDGLYINPCDPVGTAISLGIEAYSASFQAGSIASNLGAWSTNGTLAGISAAVGAAITIGCSIDSNSDLCGQTGWTGALIGGNGGKVVGDSIAVIGAILCATGPTSPECLGHFSHRYTLLSLCLNQA